ncbi:MAG: GAF domain-containing protein [Microscillaceae bacterium]|nr:GAF domain-containing protein [Microscillaceae bacterium]
MVQIARRISDGDTSQSIRVKSEHDALANSINQMIDHFKKQNRITEGLNDLTKSISGNLTPVEIANRAVSFVSRFLEAAQGALYVYNREKESLDLLGTYAFAERDSLSNHFKLGEGLVGQVALERKEILLRSVSRKEALITTGLVQEVPRVLFATPLLHEEELYGVLELASFHDFDEAGRIFLGDANKIIAIYLHTADQNEKVKHLLQVAEEAKALSEAKTQEVMMINTQLEQNQEELRASAEELNQRSRELEIANTEMDELNQNLEKRIEARTHEINQQKEEIMAQRDNLEKANLELEAEKEKADKLLLNILPEEIAEELKTKGKTDTRYYKLSSVMFTDFEGFTRSASNMGPTELVESLNEVFAEFDEIIEKHNLEKIKTLGDGYMCAGGLPVPNLTNPIEMVLAGLEIQRYMHKKKMEKKLQGEDYWGLRLGINSGEVIAGVIGTRKFAYDVWGDTVNAASRMESNGESGKVNISQRTYELVKDFFICDYRGKLVVKGKGEMDMYFVRALKPELSIGGLGIEPNELFYQNLKAYELNILSSIEL